jgi:hypothetical protein
VTTTRSRAAERLTIAECAEDRVPQRYLAASTGPALALGRIADKPAWAAAPRSWHRRALGDKDFCHAEHSDDNKQASKEAQLWTPTPAPGSTKQWHKSPTKLAQRCTSTTIQAAPPAGWSYAIPVTIAAPSSRPLNSKTTEHCA